MKKLLFFFLLVLLSCTVHKKEVKDFDCTDISLVLSKMTDIMVHDITNPPLAARFFSYSCLAGYEVICENDSAYKSMHTVLNDYPLLKKNDNIQNYDVKLSALLAIMNTAEALQPSGFLLKQYEQQFLDSCIHAGIDKNVIENSKKYAAYTSKEILAYAAADNYNKLSNFPRYTPLNKEGTWYPTPPAFMAAVEPYFNRVRPFLLDSATQFKPPVPVPFSSKKNSGFFRQMLLNYNDTLSMEKKEIASFWDCNPFAVQNNGHLMAGIKKISPGAHWLGIAGIACATSKKSFEEAMLINTVMSVGLMDAFICCWDEKYRSNRIRPETAIRKYIDPTWQPLLQTPPFPEYLSGHSVVSATSAVILSHYFGDKFFFRDSVEISYGLPPKSFHSFQEAAIEAGLSRFYGGIHFMDAINNGRAQGLLVGKFVLNKMEILSAKK
jgi:hypothetical protein